MIKKQKTNTKELSKLGNTNYPVGDFLIQLKNASMARNKKVVVKESKFIHSVAKVLVEDGYLHDIEAKDGLLTVRIAFQMKEPVMLGLKLVSTPGLRVYMGVDELEKQRGPEVYYLSSPEGIISSKTATKKRIGGEVIFKIW